MYQGQSIHPSAMSSSSSLNSPTSLESGGGRKRGKSLSASSPQVITTDMVRPDWAKKLADARAHALRRSAAATALHNAAYVIGNNPSDSRGFGLGRRRRTFLNSDSQNSSGSGTPRNGSGDALTQLLGSSSRERATEGQDLVAGRQSSRRSRMEDLEELMMMEAIRLSLAAEEERKRKEEKEAEKKAKKEEKKKAKEEKKAQKQGRKSGFFPIDIPDDNPAPAGPSGQGDSKGKAIDRSGAGFNPMSEPTSTLNTGASSSARADPQKHLEESRARIQKPADSLSNASSSASSFAESETESTRVNDVGANSGSSFEPSPNTSGVSLGGGASPVDANFGNDTPPGGGAGTEPMFNFRSLAAVIGTEEDREKSNSEHIEDIGPSTTPAEASEQEKTSLEQESPGLNVPGLSPASAEGSSATRSRGDSGESSSSSAPPPVLVTPASPPPDAKAPSLPMPDFGSDDFNQKSSGNVQIDEQERHETNAL